MLLCALGAGGEGSILPQPFMKHKSTVGGVPSPDVGTWPLSFKGLIDEGDVLLIVPRGFSYVTIPGSLWGELLLGVAGGPSCVLLVFFPQGSGVDEQF